MDIQPDISRPTQPNGVGHTTPPTQLNGIGHVTPPIQPNVVGDGHHDSSASSFIPFTPPTPPNVVGDDHHIPIEPEDIEEWEPPAELEPPEESEPATPPLGTPPHPDEVDDEEYEYYHDYRRLRDPYGSPPPSPRSWDSDHYMHPNDWDSNEGPAAESPAAESPAAEEWDSPTFEAPNESENMQVDPTTSS